MLQLIPSSVQFVSAITVLGGLFYLFMKYKHTYWQRRGVRSFPTHWLFGNIKDAIFMRTSAGRLFGKFYKLVKEDDDVFGVYAFHKPILFLRNPQLIKQILIKDFHAFPDRYFDAGSFRDDIGSKSLFAIHNPEWKYLRTKMSPVFSSGKVKNLFHLITEVAELLSGHLKDQFENGTKTKSVLVRDMSSKFTNDIISSLAFGIRTDSFGTVPEFFSRIEKATKITFLGGIQFFLMFFFPTFSKFFGSPVLGSATDYVRKVFWNSIDTREATKSKRGDLIDSLVELKNQEQDKVFKFEGDTLLAQSVIFFIAGRESSVTTMTFALAQLAKEPEIQRRVREEILQKIAENGLTYEAVQKMKYLHQVISETLRLYPPAPLIDRVAAVDYKIPGSDIIIEKGTPVYVSLHGIHYDPRYHPDPMRFDPDRFSEERKSEITQCTYMPFGEGPRNCIAFRVGLLQTAVGLITVLKDYEVSLHPDTKYEEDPRSIFTSPPDGLKLNFTKIS